MVLRQMKVAADGAFEAAERKLEGGPARGER